MKHTSFSEWEMLLAILKDHRPHRNFDIPGEIKNRFYDSTDDLGMFPVAARIGTLREKKYEIKAGPPYEFGREIIREKDHYYQLIENKIYGKSPIVSAMEDLKEVTKLDKCVDKMLAPKSDKNKQLTMEFMSAHRTKLDEILT